MLKSTITTNLQFRKIKINIIVNVMLMKGKKISGKKEIQLRQNTFFFVASSLNFNSHSTQSTTTIYIKQNNLHNFNSHSTRST